MQKKNVFTNIYFPPPALVSITVYVVRVCTVDKSLENELRLGSQAYTHVGSLTSNNVLHHTTVQYMFTLPELRYILARHYYISLSAYIYCRSKFQKTATD